MSRESDDDLESFVENNLEPLNYYACNNTLKREEESRRRSQQHSLSKAVRWEHKPACQERAEYYEKANKKLSKNDKVKLTANEITRQFIMKKYNRDQEIKHQTNHPNHRLFSPASSHSNTNYNYYLRKQAKVDN
jgi:hypothetical protein